VIAGVSLALTIGMTGLATPAAQAAPSPFNAIHNAVTPLTADSFTTPSRADMPWARWNFDPAWATIDGLQADIQDAYDHNIGGLEIGQGGIPTKEQLTAIYTKANALGMTISLKVVPGLAGTTFAGTDDYARRTLNQTNQVVDAGTAVDMDVTGNAAGTIVAVLAYRCTNSPCETTGSKSLERTSVVDLTTTLTATNTSGYEGGTTTGHLVWTAPAAPADAQWVVVMLRAVAMGATPEPLSLQGTKLLTDSYDAYFAGGLGDLVKANGGDFFVDSHAGDPWGAPEELWSTNIRSEFQKAMGYDIVPNLPALMGFPMVASGFSAAQPAPPFTFSDGSDSRIQSDFNLVRTDLYTTNRLAAFQTWSHTYNMSLRVQQEDGPATSIGDQLTTSATLDQSEYESLTGSDQPDIYRPMASAVHMTGNQWFSTECCAVLNESFADTYQDTVVRMNREFAGGVDRIVYHIRPYITASNSIWPGNGFSATARVSFSGANSRIEPSWENQAALNNYFARSREVLTQGQARMDIAVYMRNYSSPSAFATADSSNRHWSDTGLQNAGYTWDYLNETLFDLPNAVVTDGVLAADGPGYKALVFDQYLLPSTNSAQGTLTTEAASKILSYAQAGLPVIFVGQPIGTGSLSDPDSAMQAILAQIMALPNVYQVTSEAAVPAKLASLGIEPNAKPASPVSLLSVNRVDAATDTTYYWLYNNAIDYWPGDNSNAGYGMNPSNLYETPDSCVVTDASSTGNNPCMKSSTPISTTVSLVGDGVPYLLDAFTGAITPITDYTRDGNRVTVTVNLAADASMIVALSSQPNRFGISALSTSVISTTADFSKQKGDTIQVGATKSGSYITTLSDGQAVTSAIADVPDAVDLTQATWQLDAEAWTPTYDYKSTEGTGDGSTATTKTPVSLTLTGLKPWPQIPALANASGVGTYTTTVTLPPTWDSSMGAILSLGEVMDMFTITVNGTTLPLTDQVTATADISPYLQAGENTISVRVTTNFNNQLYALDTSVQARGIIENYGLVGPVVLTYYRTATVLGEIVPPTNPSEPGGVQVSTGGSVVGGSSGLAPLALVLVGALAFGLWRWRRRLTD